MVKAIAAKSVGLFFNTSRRVSTQWTAEKLFNLFCTPLSGRYSKDDLQFIQTAKQYKLSTSCDQIVFHHWGGSGKRVLLIHGWESNSARWKPYVDILRKRDLDIYAIDAPAQGLSDGKTITVLRYAEAIDEVIRRCQPDIIVGHSLGGMACGYYLKHYASSVKDLVLLSTPSGLSDMMYRYFDILSLSHQMMPPLEQLFLDRYNINASKFSTANHLQGCGLDGVIVHDETDAITPYVESLQINQAWSKSNHISTNGLGHSLKDHRIISGICNYIALGELPIPVGINS